jgi:hypothetical protein
MNEFRDKSIKILQERTTQMIPYIIPSFMKHIWIKNIQINFNPYFFEFELNKKELSFMEALK